MKAITHTLAGSGLALFGLMAGAQDVPSKEIALDIKPQPMVDALNGWAQQTGFQIICPDAEATNKLDAPRVKGKLTAEAALSRLLAGTSLTYEFVNERTVAIHERLPVSMLALTPTAGKKFGERFLRLAAAQVEDAGGRSSDRGATESGTRAMAAADARDVENSKRQRGVLEEIVVTAQRREELLKDVPIAISVLSGERLDTSAAGGALEELNRVPAVATLPQPDGRASTIIRGVAPQAGASAVGYYVDSAPFTFLGTATVPDADIYDLERIEILKGPQGTGYGIGSSSGVARILTKDPDLSQFEAKGRVAVSSTEGGKVNYRTDAAVNTPVVDGRLAIRGVVGLQNWGGWIDRPNKEDYNDADATNIRFKIGAQLTDDLSAVAGIWHSERRFGPASANDDAFRNVLYDEATDASTDLYSLVLKKDFGAFSLSSATNYIDLYSSLFKRSIFTTIGNVLNDFWSTHALSEEIVLTSNGAGPWKWTAGVFYRTADEHYRLRQTSPLATINTAPFVVDDFLGADSYAAFSEVSYSLSQFEVLAGLRYSNEKRDYHSGLPGVTYATEATFTKVTPRVALSWKPDANAMMYVSYSEGFRSGLMQGQAASDRGFGSVKSDLLHNYELGNKATVFGGALSWEAAVYYMDWEDVQQNLTFPFGGTFIGAFVNAGSASGYGGELSVTLRPMEGLQIGGSYSRNDLTVDAEQISGGVVLYRKGDRLALSPESTYGAFADYTVPVGRDLELRIGANVSHVSSQFLRFLLGSVTDIPNEPTTMARVNVSVGRSDGSSSVSLFVENLTDEEGPVMNNYAAATPPIGNGDEGVRPRPRTVGLQVDMKF